MYKAILISLLLAFSSCRTIKTSIDKDVSDDPLPKSYDFRVEYQTVFQRQLKIKIYAIQQPLSQESPLWLFVSVKKQGNMLNYLLKTKFPVKITNVNKKSCLIMELL